MNRYERQIAVTEFGIDGQCQLREAHVLVVGAGGLAAPVLQYLGGAGLGCLQIADPDEIQLSNLHRQTLFDVSDIGQNKAIQAALFVTKRNPDVRVEAITSAITPHNVQNIVKDVDLVIDCADAFAVSYFLSDICLQKSIPLISASVVGTQGYVGCFCGSAPSLRAVFPQVPPQLTTCAESGVLGPVVGVLGSLQAQLALQILSALSPSPMGTLIRYDGLKQHFATFAFHDAPEPEDSWPFIAQEDFTTQDIIIDLREPEEGPLVHKQALRLNLEQLKNHVAEADSSSRIVLCCRSGLRAWQAGLQIEPLFKGHLCLHATG
jgi:molybdopterin/thiamine biosynthesis adenylyltransferase